MELPHYGIDQGILEVPAMIDQALNQLRIAGFRINGNCRFEQYKRKFSKDYIDSIVRQNFSGIRENYKDILQGYKDYWELISIASSNNILTCGNRDVRNEIELIFGGNIVENDNDTKPWNYQFQYYLSSIFEMSGINVKLEEPDFTFEFKGKKYSVAAKRLNGRNSIERNIKEAEHQVSLTDNYGFIALSLDKVYKNMNKVETFKDADKSVRVANELIQVIIKDQMKYKYFDTRSDQILGVIAHIGFPYLLESDKPLFELGYTAYTMFLPLKPPDSAEWNEVIEINNRLHKFNIQII